MCVDNSDTYSIVNHAVKNYILKKPIYIFKYCNNQHDSEWRFRLPNLSLPHLKTKTKNENKNEQ